ncbi:MAG: DUF1461 domain-containing protein [Eggerthellaceae bacterium]|nr:DUF1461 domain-containing protein [Eggerthellaceae bacterium]
MKIQNGIAGFIATVALVMVFVGAGFLACLAPPFTHGLSSLFSDDQTSPFNRTQLTQVADATRDYSFFGHDRAALYRAIFQIDVQYRQEVLSAGGKVPVGFPNVDVVNDANDEMQLASAFVGASELYCYSPESVSHLDDCYSIARTAYVVLAICAIAAIAGLIACGVMGRKRLIGNVLMASGITVFVVFIALGAFAAIDFGRFFALFHGVLFSQGNWTFPYDSLLICALPTEFWVGMGVIWLVGTALVSILSIAIGARLRK